ncbi:MAG: diguanylate cyclase [Synechococcus sp.]
MSFFSFQRFRLQWGLRLLPVRLMLSMAGLAISSITSVTFLTIDRERREFKAELEGQAELLLNSLELAAVTLQVQEEMQALDSLLLPSTIDGNDALRAALYTVDGRVFAGVSGGMKTVSPEILRSLHQRTTTQFYWQSDHLLAARRVTPQNVAGLDRSARSELAGQIAVVELSTVMLKQDIQRTWVNALEVALGAGAVSTLLALMLSRTITGPLKQMVTVTERIASGQFSERLPERKGGQELSTVSGAFNRMSEQLQLLVARQRALVRYSLDAIVVLDRQGKVLEYNPAAERMFSLSDDGVISQPFFQFAIDYPWREQLEADVLSVQEQNASCLVGRWQEVEALRANGCRFWAEVSVTNITVRDDSLFTVTLRDITERRQAATRLQQSEERFRQIIHRAPIGIALADAASGIIQQVNPALCNIVGVEEADLMGCSFEQLGIALPRIGIPPYATGDPQEVNSANVLPGDRLPAVLPNQAADPPSREANPPPPMGEADRTEQRYRCRNGQEIWLGMTVTVLVGIGQDPVTLVMLEDITERKQVELQLRHEALHDSLTGLPNRTLLLKRLSRACERFHSFKTGHDFAVLFLDCDRFKEINDLLGHEVGDRLLIALAHRLESCVREGDTVARLGGDEFTVLLEHIREADEAQRVANRMLQSLRLPFDLGDRQVVATVSIGIVNSHIRYRDPETILKDADAAMYKAKALGRKQQTLYGAISESG